MGKIKKNRPKTVGQITKAAAPDPELRFSFKLFDHTDGEVCPAIFRDGYTQALAQRLRDVSSWTVKQFTTKKDPSLRNHTHDWTKTARPKGYAQTNSQFKAYPGWQFCLSANERGRVHGLLIDDTFYVVWLDQDHKLYPGQ